MRVHSSLCTLTVSHHGPWKPSQEISDIKIVNPVCGYSQIHITGNLLKYLNQRYCFTLYRKGFMCFNLEPPFKEIYNKLRYNGSRVMWKNVIFVRGYPFSFRPSSFVYHKSLISKPIFFSIRKANFIFMFGCSKFCSGSWWIIFGVSTNANESSMTYHIYDRIYTLYCLSFYEIRVSNFSLGGDREQKSS